MRSKPRVLEQLEGRVLLTGSPTPSALQPAGSELVAETSRCESVLGPSSAVMLARNSGEAEISELGVLDSIRSVYEYVGEWDESDTYRFQLATPSLVDIVMEGVWNDAKILLRSATGNTLATMSATRSQPSHVEVELDSGLYFLVISRSPQTSTTYRLNLTPTPTLSVDMAGNQFAEAHPIAAPTAASIVESVGSATDNVDFYRFDIAAPSDVSVTLAGMADDADIAIYNSGHQAVAWSTNAGTASESIVGRLAAGRYYIGVFPFGPATTQYNLGVTVATVGSATTQSTSPHPSADQLQSETAPLTAGLPLPPNKGTWSPSLVPSLIDVPYVGEARDWAVNLVNAPEAWNAGFTGQGVVVAIVDTGVNLTHAELSDSLWSNEKEAPDDGIDNDGNGFVDDFQGWDFVQPGTSPDDQNRHGSQLAGVIVANRDEVGGTGVAYDAKIMPVRVLDERGAGATRSVADGIRYAVDQGADIINLSLGAGSSDILAAIRYAAEHDVLVVAASGNDGTSSPVYPARHSASSPNVISVGAFSAGGERASFSNQVGESQAVQVDAPGVGVESTALGNTYRTMSGTSIAAPFVSGVAALTLSANPDLTAAELRDILARSANIPVAGSDSHGGVNAAAAISLALSEEFMASQPAVSDLAIGEPTQPVDAEVRALVFASMTANWHQI